MVQLCIFLDVQRNCPSAYEDLGLSEGYCETLPLFDDCLGNNKTGKSGPAKIFIFGNTQLFDKTEANGEMSVKRI